MFKKNQRSYSLTAYTGVGEPPPNRPTPNPAAVAAAGAAGLSRSNSTASNLSSAAAAAAIGRHSLTSEKAAAAEKLRRTGSVGSTISSASNRPKREARGGFRRGPTGPSCLPGTPRRNTTRTTSHIENTGRTMSLTTTTIRHLGSFELVTTKTIPIHSNKPRRRPGYASSNLSFESDLNPVTEEDMFESIEERLEAPKESQQKNKEAAQSPLRTPLRNRARSSHAESDIPLISLSSSLDDNRPLSPGSPSMKAVTRHKPLSRSSSPIKSALRAPSVASSSDEQVSPELAVRADKAHHRVSFQPGGEVIVVDNEPQQRTLMVPTPTAAAAQRATFNQKQRASELIQLKNITSSAAASAATKVNNSRRELSAVVAPSSPVVDSDSGNSIYSDAFEYNDEIHIDAMGSTKLRKKATIRAPASVPRMNGVMESSTAQKSQRQNGSAHIYRELAEDESDSNEEDNDTISLNSDSSWKKSRTSAPSRSGGFRLSLREDKSKANQMTLQTNGTVDRKSGSQGGFQGGFEGFRAHSLRGDAQRPDFGHNTVASVPVLKSPVPQRRPSASSFDYSSKRASRGFSRTTLRDDRQEAQRVPRREPEFTGLGGLGFSSRISDSDSDDGLDQAASAHTTPLPSAPQTGRGKLKGMKNMLSPSKPAKYLIPKNSSSKMKLQRESRHPPIPETYYESPAQLAKKIAQQQQANAAQYGTKKKKFPGLRKVFGLD